MLLRKNKMACWCSNWRLNSFMIRLELSMAVAIYIFLTVIGVLLLWVSLGKDKKVSYYASKKRNIWQCSICTYTYVDSMREIISKCPQCGSFNKRGGAS